MAASRAAPSTASKSSLEKSTPSLPGPASSARTCASGSPTCCSKARRPWRWTWRCSKRSSRSTSARSTARRCPSCCPTRTSSRPCSTAIPGTSMRTRSAAAPVPPGSIARSSSSRASPATSSRRRASAGPITAAHRASASQAAATFLQVSSAACSPAARSRSTPCCGRSGCTGRPERASRRRSGRSASWRARSPAKSRAYSPAAALLAW